MHQRKVTNVVSDRYKSKISFREMVSERPKDLMKFYGLSEHKLQQELGKHCGDAKQLEQREVYKEVYKTKK